jgi:hypothetical protein
MPALQDWASDDGDLASGEQRFLTTPIDVRYNA